MTYDQSKSCKKAYGNKMEVDYYSNNIYLGTGKVLKISKGLLIIQRLFDKHIVKICPENCKMADYGITNI